MNEIIFSVLIPFIGTILGSSCVFFVKDKLSNTLQRAFSGFAGGVMIAASIWSLILPSFEMTNNEKYAFLPVIIGIWLGFIFLMLLDKIIPHIHIDSNHKEGISCNWKKSTMTALAVIMHNLPEGMAVGIVLASSQNNPGSVPITMAIALSIGIAVQNFPEGAIVSIPLMSWGLKKQKNIFDGSIIRDS